MISTECGAQWLNRAQNVAQETKLKPKLHFQAQYPFLSPTSKRLIKSVHMCMDAYAPNVNAYVLFGQKPKIDFFSPFWWDFWSINLAHWLIKMSHQTLASTKPINTPTFHHQKDPNFSPIEEVLSKSLQNT